MPSSPPYPNGTIFNDRYTVDAFLGQGSAGAVYRVVDAHMDTQVALKILPPTGGQPAAWDEAQILEKLRGDYLLPVYNADVISGTDIRFITTKVMHGGDLESECNPSGSEVGLAVRWASHIAHAVERIHSAGLLHRDIKPGNCFLDEAAGAHLADLGLAVSMDGSGKTAPNGTIATVAPEVLDGPTAYCSIASEVYSLGATTFYLMAGTYPVHDQSRDRAWHRDQIVAGNRQRLRDLAPHVTQSMAGAVERALAQDPLARQASALEFANQIATAKQRRRKWQLVRHAGHLMCIEAPDEKARKGVGVCAISGPSNFSIEARTTSGRILRSHSRSNVRWADVAKEMRAIAAVA